MEELERKLENLLKPMDLPWNRKKDFNPSKLKWLMKNLSKRNGSHTNYIEAMSIISELKQLG